MIIGHRKQTEKRQNIIDKVQVKQLQFLLSKAMPRQLYLKWFRKMSGLKYKFNYSFNIIFSDIVKFLYCKCLHILIYIILISSEAYSQAIFNSICFNQSNTLSNKVTCGLIDEDIVSFYGIKYATAKRWEHPKSYTYSGSDDKHQFFNFANSCPQPSKPNAGKQTEDCLYLNIWTPLQSITEHRRFPVMIYIHGGGFESGSGSMKLYNGHNFAKKGMVVVNFNYRMGIFGFFHRRDELSSGNYGLMDQSAAIKWVENNIAAFGGNPMNITLMGESAGAMSTGIYISSHPDDHHITAAIMDSNIYGAPYKNVNDAIKISDAYTKMACSLYPHNCHLQQLSTGQLLILQKTLTNKIPVPFNPKFLLTFAPYIDNRYLRNQPYNSAFKIPILTGINSQEANLFIDILNKFKGGNYITNSSYRSIQHLFLTEITFHSIDFIKRYTAQTKYLDSGTLTAAFEALANLVSDVYFTCPVINILKKSSKSYGYLFKYVTNSNILPLDSCKNYACHGEELPFVFNNKYGFGQQPIQFDNNDRAMANKLHHIWSEFILSPQHTIKEFSIFSSTNIMNVIINTNKDIGSINQTESSVNCSIFSNMYHEYEYNKWSFKNQF